MFDIIFGNKLFLLLIYSFPNVSLMAVCTFLRMLDESDKQLDELFAKFSLIQPAHLILTETIFSINSTAALVINACGEATVMLNNLRNDANNNIDCTTLAVCLWTRLFKHVNQAKNPEHINLILDNILQLMKISPNVSKICGEISFPIDKNCLTQLIDDND